MISVLAGLFTSAIQITGGQRQLLLLPLCLGIAIVYKATRLENLRDLPKAVLALWATIVIGMYAVGVALWVCFSILA